MILLVSDTSILIDLERGGVLEAAFSIGLTLIVPDLLYERELKNENGPYLLSLGLGVVGLTSSEVTFAQNVMAELPGLSLPDCFALSCATRPNHVLVTGDGLLRNEAQKRLGSVYGLFWILDQMHKNGVCTPQTLCDALARIANHPRARLPHHEVQKRLREWEKEALANQ